MIFKSMLQYTFLLYTNVVRGGLFFFTKMYIYDIVYYINDPK